MSTSESVECCPKFNPEPWEEKTISWEKKRFVKDRVTSFLHIPLNFSAVMNSNMPAIVAAGACSENIIGLADELARGADVYIQATEDVPART